MKFSRACLVRDVASNFRCAYDLAARILDGRYSQRHIQQRTIFTHADCFELVHTFAPLESLKNLRFFKLAVRRNEHRDGLPDGLLRGIAERTLRAFVPTGDNPVSVFANDGVLRGIDDRSQ